MKDIIKIGVDKDNIKID